MRAIIPVKWQNVPQGTHRHDGSVPRVRPTIVSDGCVMTAKLKKNTDNKTRKAEAARTTSRASVESELMRLAEEYVRPGARWNRPVKQRISLRLDQEKSWNG